MANTRTATAAKPASKSLADIISEATPVDVVVPICVAGQLKAEHDRLDRRLDELQDDDLRESSQKLQDSRKAEADKIAKRIRQIETEMREHTHDFVFRPLPRNAWNDLVDEHPPRQGRERQERWNLNTFMPAAVRACCVAPEGMSDADTFQNLWDNVLNEGQRTELFVGAQRANEESLSVPFSVSASAHHQSSTRSSTT